MGTGRSSQKGNPASKRMGNANLKARRAVSWRRGKLKKAARIEEQKMREAANRKRRAEGLLTPWEEAKALAKAKKEGVHA